MNINPDHVRAARPTHRRARIAVPLAAFAVSIALATAAGASSVERSTYGPASTDAMAAETTAAAAEATAAEGSAAEGTVAAGAALPVGGSTVGVAQSVVGPILVDGEGLTLYVFFNDTEGEATCVDDCAEAWPPAIVDGEPDVGELDATLFTTVDHPAGSVLKVGDWPLYRFAGDSAPGDINGQGVGGVWYVATPSGNPISLVSAAETSLGTVLVDAAGLTLYAFSNDVDGESTCVDDCAVNWPPVLIGGGEAAPGSEAPAGSAPADSAAAGDTALLVGDLDPALFTVVEHPDGPMLKVGDWPLYRFAGDAAPGDVNGQAVGDVWWAVAPDGTLIQG